MNPRDWTLWTQPVRATVFMLAGELTAAALVVYAFVTTPLPGQQDWLRFGALALCATVHIQLSRRQEERARSKKPTVHIELAGIWTFCAAVVLSVPLAVALILLVRAQRWIVARRPLHRYAFSTASMVLAAVLANEILDLFGDRVWTTWLDFAGLLTAGLVYGVVQAVLVGVALVLNGGSLTITTVLGTKEDNELEAVTIGMGIVSAVLLVNLPATVAIMVVVGVVGNRITEIRQLQMDVRTDPKTGLLNMRGWREGAERALARAERGSGDAALLMVDLDHFKAINDTWGHPAGDDMLEAVAGALRGATRPGDVVGRFGGEEFVLLLPDADAAEAEAAGERIRTMVTELRVPTTDKRGGPVAITDRTTSIGVAVHPKHGATLDELLQAADAAVYDAKESGRDRVRVAA
jgi:diguanylate cyclase (GGDEF)-like protein